MPRIPAVCRACGAVSASPLRTDRPDGDVAFDVPSPCKECGASARVPAEVLQRLESAVTAALCAGLDEDAPARLADLVTGRGRTVGGEEEPMERVEVVSRVADAEPALLPIARSLPSGTPTELAAFLRVVERALARAAGPGGDGAAGALDRALESEFREAEEGRTTGEVPVEGEREARERLDAARRNDPCPCGSGDKYKDCHWLADRRRVRG